MNGALRKIPAQRRDDVACGGPVILDLIGDLSQKCTAP
jgi:hypothetical protein